MQLIHSFLPLMPTKPKEISQLLKGQIHQTFKMLKHVIQTQ